MNRVVIEPMDNDYVIYWIEFDDTQPMNMIAQLTNCVVYSDNAIAELSESIKNIIEVCNLYDVKPIVITPIGTD